MGTLKKALAEDRETWSEQAHAVNSAASAYLDARRGTPLRIVRTTSDLAAEDPDTLLLSPGWRCAWPARLTSVADLPAVVVLEGAGTRQALGRLRG